jgi:hypothetical protein
MFANFRWTSIIQRELDDGVQITIARNLCKPMKFEDTGITKVTPNVLDLFFRLGRSIPPNSSSNSRSNCVHFRYIFRSVSTRLPLLILSVFSAEIKLTLYLDRNDFRIIASLREAI